MRTVDFADGPIHYEIDVPDLDLSDHIRDAVNSVKICFAAVNSYSTGQAIHLN
ncbi:MAG: hypothetical protein ABSG85_09990 [Spirochaetia bacterium]